MGNRKLTFAVISLVICGMLMAIYSAIRTTMVNHDRDNEDFTQSSSSFALVSMLSLEGPEGVWYRHEFILSAQKLAVSFRTFSSDLDMILLLVDSWDFMTTEVKNALQESGWLIHKVSGISPPNKWWYFNRYYNSKTFTKLWLWRLISYKAVLYVDLDMLFVNDPSSIFKAELSSLSIKDSRHKNLTYAVGMVQDLGKSNYFNAGVMLLVPQVAEYEHLIAGLSTIDYDPALAEQNFLNEFYQDRILPLPMRYNIQVSGDNYTGVINDQRYEHNGFMLSSGEPIVLIHYIGENKPWDSMRCQSNGFQKLCKIWDTQKIRRI